jgi:glycerol-3-phosphate acyltransferase PlsY
MVVFWIGGVLLGYLYGSINFAIIVTRLVSGQDIRTLGNHNPGAANVGRSLGTGWGALVLILDISKSVVPMLLLRSFLEADAPLQEIATLSVGIAAIIGHCRPLYYGFRGGRGIATSIGVYVLLVPVEALVCLFGAAGIVALSMRNVEHRFGPYTPIIFVSATPFVTLLTALLVDVSVFREIGIGNHEWPIVVGVFVLSLTILAINPTYIGHRMNDLREGRDPAHDESVTQR